MRIAIYGPNLSGKAQKKGYVHAHAEGCADKRKYGVGGVFGGETGWTLDASSEQEVVEEVFDGPMSDSEDYTWLDFRDEVWFAPCTRTLTR